MTDPFRQNQGTLTNEQKSIVQKIKTKAKELHDLYRGIEVDDEKGIGIDFCLKDEDVDNRAISIAKTELETSVMWAVKGFTKTE